MDADHRYSRGDRAALIHLGAGRCYWPGCNEPLLKKVGERYRIALDIAHIRAAKPNGQRYVPAMSSEERRSFANLIFLCVAHHKEVDEEGSEAKYPAELLQQWKDEREGSASEQLRGLREVTEGGLVDMIAAATRQRDEEVRQTLDRLEQSDSEAAELLREMRDEVRELRKSGPAISPHVVETLADAAYRLRNLDDSAHALRRAVAELRALEEAAGRMVAAAAQASRLRETADVLHEAMSKVHVLGAYADTLDSAARRIARAVDGYR